MRTLLSALLFALTLCPNLPAQEKLQSDREIPIVAWTGVPEGQTSADRFKELKESGINVNFTWYSKVEAVEKALEIAQQTGIKIMPFCPELKSEPEKTVNRLKNHPALFAYHLKDEPHNGEFAELREWVKRIQAADTKVPCYINLYPNDKCVEAFFDQNALPENPYREHVDLFLREVPVPFLSFDHYPITEKNGVRSVKVQWYENLEIVSAAARKKEIPFWAFALSNAHTNPGSAPGDPYPVPTVADLKLQMYSNLAYGAQVLQYFTYWGMKPTWMDYKGAPMTAEGKRTVIYDRVKAVNAELQQLAGVFLDSKVISVTHTGSQIPQGTKPLKQLPEKIKTLETDGGAVVSLLKKGGRQFLVIVNRDCQKPMKLTIQTDDDVKRMQKDATLVPANRYDTVTELDPGDAAIYAWE